MASQSRSTLVVSAAQANPSLDTQLLFDATYRESKGSALDEFITRLEALNKLAPKPTNFDVYQGQLVMLGVVAAVESYFRTIFRRLISVDPICQQVVQKKDVSYGAAMHLSKELLPEAILERVSFVGRESIVASLRDYLGVKGNLPPDLELAIDDYARVCQLRHCAVHRFGKLGASNAIALGLSDHSNLLEKPLKLDYVSLQNAIAISTGLVKSINNFLFNELLSRIPPEDWTGSYSQDRVIFRKYYYLFSDKVSSNRTAEPRKLYAQFVQQRL
ncbi:MAG: hypothetical protein ING60_12210 [Rhodocyclaceae bacterium]|nr:hypothetical protein [Rhodocyclaceae bacterium]